MIAIPARMGISAEQLAAFCERWQITELAAFGSILRDDFRPDSDVDLLVTYAPDAHWSLLDHVAMQQELSDLLGRKVDIFTRRAVERSKNRYRRTAILETAEPIYVAG
jgi:predicted nucleotidyltransferase